MKTPEFSELKKHIPALDGVRGFAALSVFVLHYGGGAQSHFLPVRIVGKALHLGWTGVPLFFVLSGFLITGVLWDGFHREHWWRNFYIRRSLRIFPLYYLALLIALVIGLTVDAGSHNLHMLLVYAFYLQNLPTLSVHVHQFPHIWLDHFWSLAVEEQFYFIWPFLLFFSADRRNRRYALGLCAAGWVLSSVFRVGVVASHAPLNWALAFLAGRAGDLCAGAFLAIAIRGTSETREWYLRLVPYVLSGAAIALILTIYLSQSLAGETPWMATLGISALSVFFTGIVAGCLYPNPIRRFFSIAFLRWLGKISYGIYIYHLLFRAQYRWLAMQLDPHASRDTELALTGVVAAIGTLAIASLSFYTYEQFFLRMKDRFSATRSPDSSSVTA